MLETIKTWISEHKTALIIAAVIVVVLICVWAYTKYNLAQIAKATSSHIDSIVATEVQKNEVNTNAEAVKNIAKQNDEKIQEAVKEAASNIPNSLDALIELANTIILRSNQNR